MTDDRHMLSCDASAQLPLPHEVADPTFLSRTTVVPKINDVGRPKLPFRCRKAALWEWFFRACELHRLLDQEVKTTERKHGRGRRRLLLDRASLRARQLCAALAPLADIPDL